MKAYTILVTSSINDAKCSNAVVSEFMNEVSTSNRMPSSAINFSSVSYHESNLSLIARETMRLLMAVSAIQIQPKGISLEQICY